MDQLRSGNLLSLKMLNEICILLKNLEIYGQIEKDEFYEVLHEFNIFETLEEILKDSTSKSTH